jgi:thymidine phosphorylase
VDARAIIAKLRRAQMPDAQELAWFSQGLADGSVSDAQAGAFAMAICLNKLGDDGRVALTLGMRDSGRILDWDMDGPVLDKHSTGGIGDCVSLLLAPAVAACGGYVPMISGRGLGHTGGTLDKLEAIPGLATTLDEKRFRDVVATTGCAIVGASADIAPADKRLYAVRDVTATVESLDLITASILSKKLAAGLDALVLDVKTGSGAFMKSKAEAVALAQALVQTANSAGCKTTAILTDMSQPLVPSLGNALEVAEIMRVLTQQATGPIAEVTCALGGVLLANAGLAPDANAGAEAINAALRDGRAADRFGKMVAAMGGPVHFVDNWSRFLPEATVISEVRAGMNGFIHSMDGEALGLSVVALGGGRQVESDSVDPAVGLSDVLPLGTAVQRGQTIARVHAAREDAARQAVDTVGKAIRITPDKPDVVALIQDRVG